jgi:mono/diheme cytochrome c family protein
MAVRKHFGWVLVAGASLLVTGVAGLVTPLALNAQATAAQATAADKSEVTFTRDIAPILQRSCQNCHRPGQVAPMSLITYEEARPWARSMKARTAIRDKAGAMPPWYIEKNIGIQHYKNDPSLSDEEIAKIAKWADSGAPRGNPADMPPPKTWPDGAGWHAGEPDLIVESPEITVKANSPDWWGEFPPTKLPITEDRYVKSVEIREVNNFSNESGRQTVGQRYVWHHLICTRSAVTVDIERPFRTSVTASVAGPTAAVRRKLVVSVRTDRPGSAVTASAPRTASAHRYPPCTPTSDDQPLSSSTPNSPG